MSFPLKVRSVRGNNGGGGGGGGTGTKCGRWNPTVEQLKVLTDLFRAGLRTPTTDQIQKISTELSFYGKIENVFELNEEEEERVIETLQLFPVNSFQESKVDKMRSRVNNQYREYIRETNTTTFPSYSSCGAEMEHPSPLELRLSFL
ncbi:hypothetical protein Bca52824_025634 [Brassica carinata]|uniref:Homeobox domain-containing protein n=1 Tax=Brassica carinata TaxID=52824 RepID=A0A8X7V9Z9_BRACI|nr:hypothetical protein Bca52824_025634 [Brassica carinata]